jgi:1-aminocyclopropane-1-carboxylate deaminase/D-cysteine desulfhydrase-like pyridoxal-dependent ACC family enzyme
MATALAALMSLPTIPLAMHPTPIDELTRLRHALGPTCPRLLMKRDDLLSFAMGGNKVRKLQAVAAEARAAHADTLITCGGVQSNHARVTAATGAALGFHVILVLNGPRPDPLTGNALLDDLFGADVRYVSSRELRVPVMEAVAAEVRAAGRRPFIVPLGASTPTGAIGFARGVSELAASTARPDVIVHATSSGGTQAGLILGCALFGLGARVIGVSADEPAPMLADVVSRLVNEAGARLGAAPHTIGADRPIDIDDSCVGEGYGRPTLASAEALRLLARTEGIVLDPVYTSKAMAGLIARIRADEFGPDDTVLFWHTGGQPGLFA